MSDNRKYVQTNTLYLAGSGVIVGATSITLQTLTDIYGNVLAMSDFGTKGYGTLEPDTTNEEGFTFTGLTANANGTTTLSGVSTILAKSPYTETSGLIRLHAGGTKVVITDNVAFWDSFANKENDETIDGQWTFSIFPITPSNSNASSTVAGVTKLSIDPAVPTSPIAVGVNDTTIFAPLASKVQTGSISAYAGITVPSGWLSCDGSAISRATFASLFTALSKSQTATMTIASPAVITSNAHGLVVGSRVYFTTTSALPTGITASTDYYVISAGLTANAFEIAATPGGTAINTSGSQSGVHTLWITPWGAGDHSTTFNVPDLRGRTPVGAGTGTAVATFVSRSTNTITVNGLSPNSNNEFQTGQAVTYHTSSGVMTGLTNDTIYYVIRISNTSFQLASTLANAQAGTVISLSSDGSGTQTFTLSLTARNLADTGGEENHAMSSTELLTHAHRWYALGTGFVSNMFTSSGAGGPGVPNTSANNGGGTQPIENTGGNAAMNVMQPFAAITYIIKT